MDYGREYPYWNDKDLTFSIDVRISQDIDTA